MKLSKNGFAVLLLITALLCTACRREEEKAIPQTSIETAAACQENIQQPDPMQDRIEKRCKEIAAVYFDSYTAAEKTEPEEGWSRQTLTQSCIDTIEELLAKAGFDVVDTNGEYPAYLTTAENFRKFWQLVQQGGAAEQEMIEITGSGNLSYMLFTYSGGSALYYCAWYDLDAAQMSYYEIYNVLDWELTEKENFFYQIHPGDNKHYDDYEMIRMTPPDLELQDMTQRYITPVGYIATNLFLCDWWETDFGELSFNDLWEYFYYACYTEQYCPGPDDNLPKCNGFQIPASEFERIVMPYFNIDLDTFREKALYDAEGDYYPWRAVDTNDFVPLWYYACTPEVTAYEQNPDGTLTLTVEVLSADLKLDCLFAHEVTVRPLEDGGFQYVGNRVIYQTEYGLPYCVPRMLWNW